MRFNYLITEDSQEQVIASGAVSKKKYAIQTAIDMLPTASYMTITYYKGWLVKRYHEEEYYVLKNGTVSLHSHNVYK